MHIIPALLLRKTFPVDQAQRLIFVHLQDDRLLSLFPCTGRNPSFIGRQQTFLLFSRSRHPLHLRIYGICYLQSYLSRLRRRCQEK
ncbi:hypothetical protein EVA_16337 [gut metagenome]|uniref:Uncharacterized protein n=1 Tax=gut metagenome TaxID=749906 RepID=J9G192_9ZZZZ